jgi:hypothetical protein
VAPQTRGGNIAQDVGGVLKDSVTGLATRKAGIPAMFGEEFAPLVAGKKAGRAIEETARSAQFLDAMRKGHTPEAATDLVNRTHFDYTADLSDFETQVMRRLFPFYTFTRKNVPKQVKRAIQSPGKISPTLRLAEQDEGYVPEYLQSGLAIPMGEGEDGTQRYLSSLGLPEEEAFGRMRMGDTWGETAVKSVSGLGGMLRPGLRMPLEQISGKQLQTGRELDDLRPGALASGLGTLDDDTAHLLARLFSATPLTRGISTIDKLIDSRKDPLTKSVGLLSGARVTDVDVEKWAGIDARNQLEQLLRSSPGIAESNDFYVRPDDRADITPEQLEMLSLHGGLKRRARQAAEEKRKAEAEALRVGIRQ